MIKQAVNIEITNPVYGAKAIYYPLRGEVLKGVIYSDIAELTIILNGNEILLHSFRGVRSKKIAPDKKVFHITAVLKQPVIIKAECSLVTNIKVFFITETGKGAGDE